ncbi:putative sodium-dependent transporter YhdH [Geobacter sp. OR-1]|uniref:sodium-dependent transporter n=1 Tax=Geobacter sp. OR-1 TaxID=1266765 RepID=UPI0005423862|nr:sodium-dependent transporter [Geobacter sp. OR-1]GAM09325.1 putative sodium-dependent transporter YhdH [Geobacter sp. OR-1]
MTHQHAPKNKRGLWSSRFGFIMASAGSAIGLGNIWKFPYITGMHGGGAFVLFFIFCILTVGIPLMIAEMIIGRHTRKDPVGAFKSLHGGGWLLTGWLGVIAGFLILSYYCVVAGWAVDYLWLSLKGTFTVKHAVQVPEMFANLLSSDLSQLFWQAVFMGMTILIVIGGVKSGLERANKIMMPVLFLILLILAGFGLNSPGGAQALRFLFSPDWSKLDPPAMLEALGHAFFSLSLGMGAMLTYGSYSDEETSIPKVAITVSLMDTLVALLSGLAIFPIVFTYAMEPAAGPGLVFKTLPILFSRMPGGSMIAILFFLLLVFAALTSSISLLEVVVAYYCDEKHWDRRKATLVMGGIIFLLGVPSALSNNILKDLHIIGERNFLDSIDFACTNYILPLGGLLIAIFAGWVMSKGIIKGELLKGSDKINLYPAWRFLIRYVSPILVALVFLNKAGFF